MKLIIYTDGGARGNPGPAAIGIVIKNEKKETLDSFGKFLGEQTNNFAEYSALIAGLEKAKEMQATEVDCILDSELVVKQMKQEYRVKEPTLQKLFIKAWNLTQFFKKVSFYHVLRENNKEADAILNQILDEKI